jgi:ribosomal protein S18 acetylase RimI-like enzyme
MIVRIKKARRQNIPPGLTMRRIRNEQELNEWFRVWISAFEIPEPIQQGLLRRFKKKGYSAKSDVLNYAAYVGNRVVGTSTLFVGKRAAGLYNIGTLSDFRGRGIGSAMTWLALHEAEKLGQTLAVLQASEAGHPIYKKIGFEELFRFHSYVLTTP